MNAEDVFLREILEHPDDDAPRLVYADWLEEHGHAPARADVIRLQCRAARLPADDDRRLELERRSRLLLRAHRDRWLEPLRGEVRDARFARGFVEHVEADVASFVKRGGEWMQRHPVRHAALTIGRDGAGLEDLGGVSCLARLTTLELLPRRSSTGRPEPGQGVSVAEARALAASPNLAALRCLFLSHLRLPVRTVEALAPSAYLGGLESLTLAYAQLAPRSLAALADEGTLAGLVQLDLSGNQLSGQDLPLLARATGLPSLRRLRVGGGPINDDAALSSLARSPLLARLEALDLRGAWVVIPPGPGMAALVLSPALSGLRQLRVSGGSWFPLLRSPHLTGLTLLEADSSAPDPAPLAELARAPSVGALTTLRLRLHRGGQQVVEPLLRSPVPFVLRNLDIGTNELGADSAELLAGWSGADGLMSLELAENRVGPVGVGHLAGSPRLARLRTLDLGHNGIGPAGARALAESPHLTRLT
jgi:uncharacterized protein (TIGR02996 family)